MSKRRSGDVESSRDGACSKDDRVLKSSMRGGRVVQAHPVGKLIKSSNTLYSLHCQDVYNKADEETI
jgi:hypothetical protein